MDILLIAGNGLGPLSGAWLVSSVVNKDLNCSLRIFALARGSLVMSSNQYLAVVLNQRLLAFDK